MRNKEKIREYQRLWREKNKERLKIQKHNYHKKNKDKIYARHIKRWKERFASDAIFRVQNSLRSRIHDALKHNKKVQKTHKLLGCSIQEFKEYISLKFQPGMIWENHGLAGWHIDHIKPCSSFDLSKPEEQAKCFHYTNLQPLWAKDNLSKGSKY